MKKLLLMLLTVVLVGINANAQKKSSQRIQKGTSKSLYDVKFWGIPFGASRQEVKDAMIVKGAKIVEEKEDLILWDMLPKFAEIDVSAAQTEHTHTDELAGGDILLSPFEEREVFELYSDLKHLLSRKYGNPETDFDFFDEPYAKGGGKELQALKEGKYYLRSFWKINTEKGIVSIMLGTEKFAKVTISYECKPLGDKRREYYYKMRSQDL